jgi:hypothetical protein
MKIAKYFDELSRKVQKRKLEADVKAYLAKNGKLREVIERANQGSTSTGTSLSD